MKVAFLSFGFIEYSMRLASALAAEAEVMLLLPNAGIEPHRALLGPRVQLQTFVMPRLRQPLQQARMVQTIHRCIQRFQPNAIHLQGGHFWFNLSLPWLRQHPLVVTIHDSRVHPGDQLSSKTPQWIMEYGWRRASQVIVHGEQLKQAVVRELGLPADRVHVIPHIALGDERAAIQVETEENLILFFGRIWPYKGLEYLIRAEPLITAQVPAARIMIAGQGEDLGRYRQMMIHPDRFVIRDEFIPDHLVPELFRRASVVVPPYVEASASGVLALAYTFGKPVVATTVGSLPEMVRDQETGYLVPPRDEAALADAIVRLLRGGELRQRLGANGHRRINSECSPSIIASQTLAVYQKAVQPPASVSNRIGEQVR